MRICVLYSELAEYSVACLRALHKADVEVLLVHWPINPEAPFELDLSFCVHHVRDEFVGDKMRSTIRKFEPDLILCSGWMDNSYTKVCSEYFGLIPTVLSMDNHWTGKLKQHLATAISPYTLLRKFSHAFVPGNVQKAYAKRLGFKEEAILTGFYSADVAKFQDYHSELGPIRPKRFLYLGRYVEHKGIYDLWHAFKELRKLSDEWELWCVGTGDKYDERVQSEGIRHFGFVQPSELQPILEQCSVYILPSHFEPWGVSVQEMAVVGFPLILSDAIGSREAFLSEGENGYCFKSGDATSLKNAMLKITEQSQQDLVAMSEVSHTLGLSNTPEMWAEQLKSILIKP